ncbi:MAG: hypothetical protein CMJ48_09760 [Planctomycetaceae bacterium]|nr:hypothetical protein [Planctomycetaceae bacterium]
MPIEVVCESCFCTYRVKDDRLGKRIRCKECGEAILVEREDARGGALPPASRSRSAARRQTRKKPSGPGPGVWIGVGVGGLLVVGLVIFGAISFLSNGDEGGQVAGGGAQSSDDPAAAVPGGWSVQADASQDSASLSGDPAVEISILAGASMDWAVYPETSNAFVALGSNFRNEDVREVWDLRSGRKVGAISTDVGAQRGVLSPDGLHFVAMAKSKDVLLVFDVKAGKQVGEIKIPSATVSPVMRFAGPNRLVTLQRKEPLGVWSIPEGQREQSIELTKLFQINSLAVSPGGRFAAAVVNDDDSNKSVLRIYDLDAGKLAGGISLQSYAEATNLMCESLAFSPDGSELAGVLKTYADGGKQWLVGWDMKSGKPAFEHDVATDLQTKAVSGTNSSPHVRWFPDGKWLLLFGRYIFDREVGGPIWRVPDDKELTGEATNVAGNNQVLVVSGPHKKRRVHTITLPRDEIAASSAAVSAGGLAEDAGLPAITTADFSGVKTVELSDAPVPWEVEADPPPPAKGPFLETPLAVDAAADSIGSVLLSSPESARAIVAQDRFADQSIVASYELAEGSEPQSFEITFGTEVLALSPDGTRLLTRAKQSPGRLDVWSVPDGEHVLGWRPHQQEKEAMAKVVAARFVDATHVLTLSAGRKLTLWELPSCRAVYRIENVAQSSVPSPYSLQMTRVLSLRDAYQPGSASSTARAGDSDPVQPHPSPGLPAISPNGRTIALLYAGRMTFLDSLSGDVRGSVSVAGCRGSDAARRRGFGFDQSRRRQDHRRVSIASLRKLVALVEREYAATR